MTPTLRFVDPELARFRDEVKALARRVAVIPRSERTPPAADAGSRPTTARRPARTGTTSGA